MSGSSCYTFSLWTSHAFDLCSTVHGTWGRGLKSLCQPRVGISSILQWRTKAFLVFSHNQRGCSWTLLRHAHILPYSVSREVLINGLGTVLSWAMAPTLKALWMLEEWVGGWHEAPSLSSNLLQFLCCPHPSACSSLPPQACRCQRWGWIMGPRGTLNRTDRSLSDKSIHPSVYLLSLFLRALALLEASAQSPLI